jgi:hypothetical protein
MGKTWDAAIDVFADSNLAIANIERVSGFISAAPVTLHNISMGDSPHAWADCGKNSLGRFDWPTAATYSVVIRGDSSRTVVKAAARFVTAPSNSTTATECSSRGVWESAFEGLIVDRARKKGSQ